VYGHLLLFAGKANAPQRASCCCCCGGGGCQLC
jgi:hypothetical protein